MIETEDDRNIYCARLPGRPGFCAVMVDHADHKKYTARDIADWVKSGYEVAGKFTRAEAVEGLTLFAADRDARAANPAKATPVSDSLPLFSQGATA